VNELERALVAAGRELDVPETPNLAPGVLAAIARGRDTRRAKLQRVTWRPARRRMAVAVALVLVAALGATLAIPEARSAFLRIFDVGGERIEVVDDLPDIPVSEELESTLGERVTLAEAKLRAGFPLRELPDEPDRVYLGDRGSVWFLYGDPEHPRLLVSQFPLVDVDEPALLKKLAGEGTRIEEVSVGGARGVFLSGEPHFFFYFYEDGRIVEDSARLARDVLVWDEGGVAYRLEGDFEREDALRLARALRQRG
jgi:hypothetical protein